MRINNFTGCRRVTLAALLIASTSYLSGCGGGGSGSSGPQAIAPGQTVTLTAGESVLVPPGTTVYDPASKSTVNVMGDNNTVNTSAGAQVSVPATATGAADNTVIAH